MSTLSIGVVVAALKEVEAKARHANWAREMRKYAADMPSRELKRLTNEGDIRWALQHDTDSDELIKRGALVNLSSRWYVDESRLEFHELPPTSVNDLMFSSDDAIAAVVEAYNNFPNIDHPDFLDRVAENYHIKFRNRHTDLPASVTRPFAELDDDIKEIGRDAARNAIAVFRDYLGSLDHTTIRTQIERCIRDALNKISVPPIQINPDSNLINDIGLDSIDMIVFIMNLNDEFNIMIDPDDVDQWKTVGDVEAYVRKCFNARVDS